MYQNQTLTVHFRTIRHLAKELKLFIISLLLFWHIIPSR